MKNYVYIIAALFLFSCSVDEQEEIVLDCNCDRVAEVTTFNMIGTPQDPQIRYVSVYYTINDCTQVQKQKDHITVNLNNVPQVGQCR
jgi:hypothetical protein